MTSKLVRLMVGVTAPIEGIRQVYVVQRKQRGSNMSNLIDCRDRMPSDTVPKADSNLPSKGTQQSPLLEDTELREPQSGCEIDPNSVVLPIQSNSPQLNTSDTYQTPESPITRDPMDTHPSRECHLQPVVEEDVVITGESQKSRGNTLMMIDHNPQESGNTYGDTKEKGCHDCCPADNRPTVHFF